MQTIEKTIEVERPVSAVYDQWSRFQDFPQFMKSVKQVHRVDDRHLRWKAVIGGRSEGWDAEIVEQVPDQRISWRSTSGAENSGTITFVSLTPARTRVILYLTFKPKGLLENLGGNLGLISTKVVQELNCFKEYMESRVSALINGRIVEVFAPAQE